jgi:hypothetical protein
MTATRRTAHQPRFLVLGAINNPLDQGEYRAQSKLSKNLAKEQR